MRTAALAIALALLSGTGCGACGKNGRAGLRFSPDKLPDGVTGEPYRVPINVSGAHTPVGGMSVSQGALPPGIELHFERHAEPQDTAIIEGTPTKSGEYAFTLSAWCFGTNVSGQTGAREFRIVIR